MKRLVSYTALGIIVIFTADFISNAFVPVRIRHPIPSPSQPPPQPERQAGDFNGEVFAFASGGGGFGGKAFVNSDEATPIDSLSHDDTKITRSMPPAESSPMHRGGDLLDTTESVMLLRHFSSKSTFETTVLPDTVRTQVRSWFSRHRYHRYHRYHSYKTSSCNSKVYYNQNVAQSEC